MDNISISVGKHSYIIILYYTCKNIHMYVHKHTHTHNVIHTLYMQLLLGIHFKYLDNIATISKTKKKSNKNHYNDLSTKDKREHC